MSKYMNYEKAAERYDTTRYATGVETIVSIVSGLVKKNVQEISLLDAGCGTGNYSLAFLQNGIGSISMIDGSIAMLEKAKEKTLSFGAKVKEIKEHYLPSLPYPDNSFDVVCLCQVTHHLDTYHLENGALSRDQSQATSKTDADRYPNLSKVISESLRVLKKHGVLVIDTCFTSNIDASWISLAPKAACLNKQAFLNEQTLIQMLKYGGFQNVFYVQRPGSHCTKEALYENPEKALDPNFRATLSEWTFVERSGELPGLLAMLQKKKDEGTLKEFFQENSKLFNVIGETTTIFAQKKMNTISPNI